MRGKKLSVPLFIAFCLFFTARANAQQGFFIPKNAKVYFGGDTATIFSDVHNKGKLGVGKKAVVNFKGQLWENDPGAIISDESDTTTGIGGWIRFMNEASAQRLISGYNAATRSGATFPNLQLSNPHGLYLLQSSAKVRNEFSFDKGLVYLNNNLFVVGHRAPGRISGFSNKKFFVTTSQPGGGMLLRENISAADNMVVFPIGTKDGSYTPAAIRSKTTQGDDYFATVFDGVKSNLQSGTNLAAEGVNKTWQIGKLLHPGQGEAEVYLQHLVADEGVRFQRNRSRAYVSQFVGGRWDTGSPKSVPLPGTLTVTPADGSGGLNHRIFTTTFDQGSYFTKFAADDTLTTKLILGAYRLNTSKVIVNWQTKPEINVRYFIVQRRLSNETNFRSLAIVRSQAPNGISIGYLNYSYDDPNSYSGISYYRLQVFDYTGRSYYTVVVAVSGLTDNRMVLWPNPTNDQFSAIVNSPIAAWLVIYNALGQKMYTKSINVQNQNVVEVRGHGLISGTYFVGILDKEGRIIDRAKLVIQK